jgi:hypothetical protein
VAPRNPVYVKRTCGHVGVANSLALEAGGIVEEAPNPQGGALERQNGRLTGLLMETAQRLVSTIIPKPSVGAMVEAIERAGMACASHGIASVMDANVGARCGMDEIAAYETARRPAGCRCAPTCAAAAPTGGRAGPRPRPRDEVGRRHAAGRPGQVFTDGSAGGRTAAMFEPYEGGDEHDTGILVWDEDVRRWSDYHAKGYQMALHGIGDHAIQICLDAVENALARCRRPTAATHRALRLHERRPDRPDGAARHVAAPQPVHVRFRRPLHLGAGRGGRRPATRCGAGRPGVPRRQHRLPVCDINPFVNLYGTITRKTSRGVVLGGQERLGVGEALHAMTANGAYVSFCEGDKGTLEPGMLADIAVLSRDVFTCDPEAIRSDTRCDLTLRGGAVSFDRHGQLAA